MAETTQTHIVRGTIGVLSEYRMGTDWQTYQERLEQYFLANYIEQDRRVVVLLTLLSHATDSSVRRIYRTADRPTLLSHATDSSVRRIYRTADRPYGDNSYPFHVRIM
ncbi:hypothetical protein QE152_g9339 [Popillia japonica]|uniref:Uncharacterized protein n=1 Tax=Popillia japonica TaxID=7064 RepID=A0AAW1LZ47_POPJA